MSPSGTMFFMNVEWTTTWGLTRWQLDFSGKARFFPRNVMALVMSTILIVQRRQVPRAEGCRRFIFPPRMPWLQELPLLSDEKRISALDCNRSSADNQCGISVASERCFNSNRAQD